MRLPTTPNAPHVHQEPLYQITGGHAPSAEADPLLLRLHATTNIAQFWGALQALLMKRVPHDALVAYLNFFDFSSSWRAAEILMTPNAQRPLTWFEGRREVDMTPQFVLAQPQKIKVYRLSDIVSDPSTLHRTAFFQNYLAPGGWHHLAVCLFWRGRTVSSEIAIRRTKEQGDFTRAEIKILEELHSHIGVVINRLVSEQEERARRCWLEQLNDHLPFALQFLDLDLETLYVNNEGMAQCAAWNFGPQKATAYQPRDVYRVPDVILRTCADLKRRWLQQAPAGDPVPGNQISARVIHPDYRGLIANVTLQTETPCPAVKPMFMIHLSRQADVNLHDSPLPVHSMLAKLTDAERKIARRVVAGHSNNEIADELKKSVHTVKCQITSIYKKIGVTRRSQLMAMMHN